MNKKLVTGLSIVLGGVMLCSAAFVNASTSSGYEVYKSALKNTRTISSVTGTVGVSVQDNGTTLIKVDDAMKMNQENRAMSGVLSITAGDQVKTLSVYHQDGQTILKNSDSDEYNVSASKPDKKFDDQRDLHEPADQVLAQEVENLVDLLVGNNIQDSFVLNNNPDGTKQISLQLAGDQISPVQNAVTSLFYKVGTMKKHASPNPIVPSADAAIASLPELVSNIHVSNIDLKATVDAQDYITGQTMEIAISGEDASGNVHNLVTSIDLDLSEINQTTPDTVDLTGKSVKTMQPQGFKHPGH